MLPVLIAPATDSERDWAARTMSESEPWITLRRGLDDCRIACADPACLLLIARRAGQPCGFVLLHPKGVAGSPYVRSIAVAPDSRGMGIGRQLLGYAEATYREQARYIFLCVSSFNLKAKALYLRCGYGVVGELADYVVDGASEILMAKRLVPE
jgi:ribosomal protein S18 acetylase RimI-like enzyme